MIEFKPGDSSTLYEPSIWRPFEIFWIMSERLVSMLLTQSSCGCFDLSALNHCTYFCTHCALVGAVAGGGQLLQLQLPVGVVGTHSQLTFGVPLQPSV